MGVGIFRTNDLVSNIVMRGFDKANQQLARFEDAGVKSAQKVAESFTRVGQTLTLGVTIPILAGSVAVIKLGIDAVETSSLIETSFGDMTQAIQDWSMTSTAAFTQTKLDAQETAALFFNIARGMGLTRDASFEVATGFSEMAQDFASFFNLRPDEAIEKVRAGLVGQFEPLQSIGIILDKEILTNQAYKDGLLEVGEALDRTTQVQATFNAIVERAGPAIGDVARTADSAANRLRAMTADIKSAGQEMGLALIPAFEELLEIVEPLIDDVGELATKFSELDESQQRTVITLIAMAAALGPLLIGLGQLASIAAVIGAGPLAAILGIGLVGTQAVIAGQATTAETFRGDFGDPRGFPGFSALGPQIGEGVEAKRLRAQFFRENPEAFLDFIRNIRGPSEIAGGAIDGAAAITDPLLGLGAGGGGAAAAIIGPKAARNAFLQAQALKGDPFAKLSLGGQVAFQQAILSASGLAFTPGKKPTDFDAIDSLKKLPVTEAELDEIRARKAGIRVGKTTEGGGFLATDQAQIAAVLAQGALQGKEGLIGAAGTATTIAATPFLGPFAPFAGMVVSTVLGALVRERRMDPVTEPLPVKVVNFKDMVSKLLGVTKGRLTDVAGGGIDSLANSLAIKEGQVGLEAF